jgi:hypothetical protein
MPETNTLLSPFFPVLGFYLAERQGSRDNDAAQAVRVDQLTSQSMTRESPFCSESMEDSRPA